MRKAEQYFLSILRNKATSRGAFRVAAEQLTTLLAVRALEHVQMKKVPIETTLAKTTGLTFDQRIILVPILRSGMTMVEPFLRILSDALVGVVGLRRDEKTAVAHWYYENMPPLLLTDQIIVVDPMIATGGTGKQTLELLQEKGADMTRLIYVSMVGAPEGIKTITEAFTTITLVLAAEDSHLNEKKYIVPGLGDYGDRYFGTD